IETLVINKAYLYHSEEILKELTKRHIDLIVLAGFLMLIPEYLVTRYPKKIINIHPALLPKYGGKGMYGHHVHEAVKAAGEKYSGMTIHYVNKNYDEGDIILQRKCRLAKKDSAEDIAKKVLKLEHRYYPVTIEKVLGDTE
ncbi:MAG: phosphoribosylglycinamide formyltransferase, partial [Bacteroidia bacterium]|nr:phosphoribosylglycinamide formyltransferase [Bacteroidia bacterium]